jgi:hypothetical protein
MPLPALLAGSLDLQLLERFEQATQSCDSGESDCGVRIAGVARKFRCLLLHAVNLS